MLANTADLGNVDRETLFNVSAPVNFDSIEHFRNAWTAIDNAWVKEGSNKRSLDGKITSTYRCRLTYKHHQKEKLQRVDNEGNPVCPRVKGYRVGVDCPAKIQVVTFADGKVEVRPQRKYTGCHTHDIAMVDEAKVPGIVRLFIENEGRKAYPPMAIKGATKHAFVDPVSNQPLFGTQHLEGSQVYNIISKVREDAVKLLKGTDNFQKDLQEAQKWLADNNYNYESKIVRTPNDSIGLVFINEKMIDTLTTCGTLVQMDATHCTNSFNWLLFTLYARDNYGSWIPCGHFITNVQNGDIIGECLKQIRQFCPPWKPHGFLADDSKIEKAGIKKAFRGIYEGQMDIKIFNCTVHTMRTFKRRFSSDKDKLIRRKMNAALYSKTKIGCEERIKEAIRLTNDNQVKNYLSNYCAHSHEWALWARSHSPFLLQMTSTNALESYHSLIKATPNIKTFSFKSLCITLSKIDDGRFVKADRARNKFRSVKLRQLSQFPGFDELPFPLQKLLVVEIKAAEKELG